MRCRLCPNARNTSLPEGMAWGHGPLQDAHGGDAARQDSGFSACMTCMRHAASRLLLLNDWRRERDSNPCTLSRSRFRDGRLTAWLSRQRTWDFLHNKARWGGGGGRPCRTRALTLPRRHNARRAGLGTLAPGRVDLERLAGAGRPRVYGAAGGSSGGSGGLG